MKLLLDTHAFLWWIDQSDHLPPAVRAACESASNSLHLSLVSVWELQIKCQLGKLRLAQPLSAILLEQTERNALTVVPITLDDVLALSKLPPLHRDPFDRLLIAQARRGAFRFVTTDREIARYDVAVFWS